MKTPKGNIVKRVIMGLFVFVILAGGYSVAKQVRNNMRENAIEKADKQRIINAQKADAKRRHEFAETIAKPAMQVWKKEHVVLPSIVIAQAIQESNWGQSKLYQKAYNIFGVKGTYKGQSISYYTDEYVSKDTKVAKGVKVVMEGDKKKISIPATFRKYPSVYAAVENHSTVVALNFIKKKNVTSYEEQAAMLQKNGYATDPNYAKSLIALIKQYDLSKYDK
ncbi:MAG: glucosaminidase domain-containing protein [Apilactobacillus sp.]|uniref:glycoside hydrolase family 73 protein n=1 Tax=Apilactobacillus TaxID=2767877 RepID=UPI0025EF5C5F|nr:glucosaminidase domain-containing protein [Apilactobacillus sp.]MCT6823052.1 glucosaminidase domain-containing protein [Apilactobacillus sp.]MCT6858372.1 glucosaminidase domain-containing protein [Apilactobacillus sp.]